MKAHFPSSHLGRKGRAAAEDEHASPNLDSEEFLARSRSVPPELEGSPHTIRSTLPIQDDDEREHEHELGYERPFLPISIPEHRFGAGGVLTALPSDSRVFLVHIEGQSLSFDLSLVPMPQRMIFHGSDEVEAVRLFEAGRIDYAQLVCEKMVLGASGEVRIHPVVADEKLVIRWVGGQYITREDGSPLMDALRLWVANAPKEPSRAMSEPPSFMREEPGSRMGEREEEPAISADEQERVSSGDESGGKRADSEPLELHRKPTSTSWVRWWNRSRDITETERPSLRVSNTVPLESVSFVIMKSMAIHDVFPETTETCFSCCSSYDVPYICVSPCCHTRRRQSSRHRAVKQGLGGKDCQDAAEVRQDIAVVL
jgi:phosphatidate phosphatase LPIN